ncbi:proline dehydrogenase family protein [Leifsonia sp. Root112D2]|uniref:proline dehydrogenase family protein n=1 Tax=Leifsonia sp. Root112D2 TaxID=1736426 RepID=UPI0007021C32|nr:proline dehydrogenase family protein [Leifsonia sp. Root112D2]KQV06580.1 1-pyrroline-5-carboxylate dehydrogenase [Leifsonia sp. Root112D2]
MTQLPQGIGSRPATLSTDAVDLVRAWLEQSSSVPADAGGKPRRRDTAALLAEVLRDRNGLDFTVGFVDGVARPQDLFVAGYNLQRIARRVPAFLPWYMKAALRVGGVLGPVLPWVVVPIARRVLRGMVGHLIVDATPEKLGAALEKLRAPARSGPTSEGRGGPRLNLNLLGEAVLGEAEAARRLAGTRALLERDDVDYVSIKVSSIASQLSMWSFDETVERVVETLTPLYEIANQANSSGSFTGVISDARPKFINLDMEEYRDLDLTLAVFRGILGKPQFQNLEAGIVLQAYLPDALDALQGLTEWAMARRAGGGAAIKVRLVKGANLPLERVDAAIHDWPLAPYATKEQTDANYKRVLDWALTPDHTHAVKLGIAGHNLFDVAWSWLLARSRGVENRVEYEMLLGMATAQADAVRKTVGELLLYTPVVNPAEFDVAISYLIRRLEENASPQNFMSSVFELDSNPALFEREKQRFLAAVAILDADNAPRGLAPLPHRTQDRQREWDNAAMFKAPAPAIPEPVEGPEDPGLTNIVLGLSRGSGGDGMLTEEPSDASATVGDSAEEPAAFRNALDTDPALPANRAWGKHILARVAASEIGVATLDAAAIDDQGVLGRVIETVRSRGVEWGARSGFDRATLLDRAGLALAANRDRLIEVMASETGKTIAEADPEVSEAIDFAYYYAARARELDTVQGATFVPARLTVVTPPWNFPASIAAGSVLGALAAGSAVIIKPAHQARRTAAVVVEALWEAGIPRELLALVELRDEASGEGSLGQALVSDPRVDRVILTGAFETAKLFRSWRPELALQAETSGKNAIIVTPSADYDLAVADVVHSAFGHAGQKCSAASLLILVGSVGKSERFLRQLVDATTSLRVGYPTDPTAQMGPLIEPPTGKLLHALTVLGAEEEWLVAPQQLDESGRLWSPGIRTGVAPGSYFHLTEFFGPVLGVMRARTLEEAIRLQNAVDYGLTSGLHSLDRDELELWLETVEAGNLYVNRGITGAIVQRQPFGGWKRSSVGTGYKAGGPNYLLGLGGWRADHGKSSTSLHLRGLDARVTELIESGQSSMGYEEFDVVRRSALSDAIAYANDYAVAKDTAAVGVERNLFRYRPMPVAVRLAESGRLPELLRILAAATLARSRFTVSSSVKLPRDIRQVLRARDVTLLVESDAEWLARASTGGLGASRVRYIGDDALAVTRVLGGDADVAVYAGEVTPSGRIELLPFLREQAVSITAHRFGTPSALSEGLL